MRLCEIEGCREKHHAKGCCIKHYREIHDREQNKLRNKKHRKLWRMKVFRLYADKCIVCGFRDERALHLDHKKYVGSKRTSWLKTFKDAIKNPDKYQLLCANHNWIKRYENKEWRKT